MKRKHHQSLRTKDVIISSLIAFALLLACLFACDNADGSLSSVGTSPGKTGQSSGNSELAETEPDYSWFEMPDETGTLTVYGTGLANLTLTPASALFSELYPDVKVEITAANSDSLEERLRTEIAAGKGPDLIVFSDVIFPDIMKTMATGVFTDLAPYFALDPEISISDFVPGVMDCGLLEGKRFLVPLSYNMPVLFTSRSLLASLGAEPEDLMTFEGFLSVAARFREVYPGQPLDLDTNLVDAPYINELRPLWIGFGFSCIDYEKNEVCLDRDLFHDYIDLLKPDYVEDYKDHDPEMDYKHSGNYWTYKGIQMRECLYTSWANGFRGFIEAKEELSKGGDEAVPFLLPGIDGSVSASAYYYTAIPRGAENPLNGWRMMKVLLSEELQTADDINGNSALSGTPVLRSAIRNRVEKDAVKYRGWGYRFGDDLVEEYIAFYETPAKLRLTPSILLKYVREEMTPYWKENKSFDTCWDSLIDMVELYKDE
jgi:ABC-type sugar transport system, periplasmic component